MTSFQELGLPSGALNAVKRLGYENPTPVQEQAIPAVLKGRDVIAAASTGTGKTAAFLLPTVSSLKRLKRGPRAPRILVVTPTRELAEQISFVSYKVAKACGQYTTVLYGGKPYGPQIRELRAGTDVLIATPGRLCDLIQRGVVNLGSIEVLVLDEADRMLDMGFLPDVRKIVELVPAERQTLLFSATIDKSVRNNLSGLLTDPEVIQIAQRGETSKIVDQYLLPVSQKEKPELLKCLLDEKGHDKVIVFARTKVRAEGVAKMLKDADYKVECIHSDKTQGQRRNALNCFRKGRADIIVATDVLARGIDIPSVDYVVNYDLPDMAEDYIHRIGRTGRAGREGFAVSFVSGNSLNTLKAIEGLLNKEIPVMRLESYELDMSILGASSRKGKPKQKKGANKGKKQPAKYNYEGWADLRNSKGAKKKAKKDDATKASGKAKGDLRPGRKSSGKATKSQESSRDKKARGQASGKSRAPKRPRRSGTTSQGARRPGFKSSGLRGRR